PPTHPTPLSLHDALPISVLLAAYHAAFDLEHDVGARALLEQLRGDPQVLLEREGRAVEHLRVKQRLPSVLAALERLRQKRAQERSEEHTSELQSRFDLVC